MSKARYRSVFLPLLAALSIGILCVLLLSYSQSGQREASSAKAEAETMQRDQGEAAEAASYIPGDEDSRAGSSSTHHASKQVTGMEAAAVMKFVTVSDTHGFHNTGRLVMPQGEQGGMPHWARPRVDAPLGQA